ncbi:low molecular weight phosphotyrosine protein phosphatase 1-like [Chironomus tepperi]|uniref:low molecular weight phosphotyrosine protein phosphatase 1-like n=1 Tax=Chironomus tepperi TaxID=113505 RepID=UPI00391F6C41
MSEKKNVLFICLGNICRSPIAEAVFIDIVKKRNLTDKFYIDSAAIGSWHIGKKPERRALETMKKHNLEYDNKARQITTEDFRKFDYIFGMDDENMSDLDERKPSDGKAKLLLLGDFDPKGERIIRDPYYDSNSDGFEKAYVQSIRCCDAFLDKHLAGEI